MIVKNRPVLKCTGAGYAIQFDAINDSGVAKILNRVGNDYVPNDLDREQLRQDICVAWTAFSVYSHTVSKDQRTKRKEYANKVLRLTNQLSDILGQTSEEADSFRRYLSCSVPLNDVRVRLQHLSQRAATFRDASAVPLLIHPVTASREISPLEWFLVVHLIRIFEQHFRLKAKRKRDDAQKPVGPFVDFAKAVCSALGLRVTAGTISKAITIANNARKRPNPLS